MSRRLSRRWQPGSPSIRGGCLCYHGNYYNVTREWNTAHDSTFKVQQDSYGRAEGYLISETSNIKMITSGDSNC